MKTGVLAAVVIATLRFYDVPYDGVDYDPPSAPDSLAVAVIAENAVELSWTSELNTHAGFTIERATAAEGPWDVVRAIGAYGRTAVDDGLSPGTTYYYRMRAFGRGGYSGYATTTSGTSRGSHVLPAFCVDDGSACAPAVVGGTGGNSPPSAPDTLTAAAVSATAINLTWADHSDDEQGFRLDRCTGGGCSTFAQVAAPGVSTNSYQDTSLAASTSYSYRLSAYNRAGGSAYSNTATASTTASVGDTKAPTTPTGVIARAPVCGAVNVTWTGSTDNPGGSGLSGYNVYRQDGTFVAFVAAPTTSYTDTGRSPSVATYYKISAKDVAANESPRSGAGGTYSQSCFGTGGDYVWARGFGGSVLNDDVRAVVADASGNVYIGGEFKGTADFGGLLLTSAGGYDAFIAKYAGTTGVLIWAIRLGSTSDEVVKGLVIDGSGNVLATGTFVGTVDFGAGPVASAGAVDTFVLKYSSAGVYTWMRQIGGPSDDIAWDIARDSSNNAVVTGQLRGATDLGDGPITNTSIYQQIFFAKYAAADGAFVWANVKGHTGDSNTAGAGKGVAVDGSGNVYVAGSYRGPVNFGGGEMASDGAANDVFIAKYNSSGAYVWAYRYGETHEQNVSAIAVDGSGHVVLAGTFLSEIDFGAGALLANSGGDAQTMFLASFAASDGAYGWAQRFPAIPIVGASTLSDVAVDSTGKVAITGSIGGAVDLGGGPMPTATIFTSKYSVAGAHLWSKTYRTNGGTGNSVAFDASGNVIAAGKFTLTTDFGGGEIRSNGDQGEDAFVVRYTP